MSQSLKAKGFASADVIMAWPDIVGERLAAFTQPLKLDWPRKRASYDPEERPSPAALIIRVESAFALDVQHLAPVIIEKVNTYFGWRCVGKLVLKQGPVHKNVAETPQAKPLTEQEKLRVNEAVLSVEDAPLREALIRLGTNILTTNKRDSS